MDERDGICSSQGSTSINTDKQAKKAILITSNRKRGVFEKIPTLCSSRKAINYISFLQTCENPRRSRAIIYYRGHLYTPVPVPSHLTMCFPFLSSWWSSRLLALSQYMSRKYDTAITDTMQSLSSANHKVNTCQLNPTQLNTTAITITITRRIQDARGAISYKLLIRKIAPKINPGASRRGYSISRMLSPTPYLRAAAALEDTATTSKRRGSRCILCC